MSDILLFAAGSLRLAFAPLLSAFQRHAGKKSRRNSARRGCCANG